MMRRRRMWRRTRASSTQSYLFQQTFLYAKIRGGEASRVDYLMHVIKSARFIISLHTFMHTYIVIPRNALVGKLYLCVTATVYTNTSKRFLFILFCLTLYVCMYVQELGCEDIYLLVDSENIAAQNLYRSSGIEISYVCMYV